MSKKFQLHINAYVHVWWWNSLENSVYLPPFLQSYVHQYYVWFHAILKVKLYHAKQEGRKEGTEREGEKEKK